jgi:hypothetical protein
LKKKRDCEKECEETKLYTSQTTSTKTDAVPQSPFLNYEILAKKKQEEKSELFQKINETHYVVA